MSQPGVVVDGHVHVVPAQAAAADLLGAAVDPPAASVGHPAEFLDVDVQQVAGVLAFVTAVAAPAPAQQLPTEPVDIGQPGQAGAGDHRADRGGSDAQDRGQPDRSGVVLHRAATIAAVISAEVRRGIDCGREERSTSPAAPSARQRRTHL
jgi:hypothetical protein